MKSTTGTSSRRRFIRGGLAAGVAGLGFRPSTWARPIGANDAIRVAIIGANGQGNNHLGKFNRMGKDCRVVAVCDPDQAVLDARKAQMVKEERHAEYIRDYRKLMERPDVDAVVIATPNHLHTIIAIAAIQAGKHVYVEKPVSHNIWEGRMLVEHAAKHPEVIVQHGMQRRSGDWSSVVEFVKSGAIGKPIVSRGFCYKLRNSIGKVGTPQPPPATVDYDLWAGPREPVPVPRRTFHYDWHWQWPWGNGDIGNQGPHQLDVARWLIGDPALPERVISIGGRYGYDDDATTANTQIAFFDYKPIPLLFEVRGLPDANLDFKGRRTHYKGVTVGNIIECEGGYVAEAKAYDNEGKEIKKFSALEGDHPKRFLENIRAGKVPATHNAETGHLSAALAHMANISYRLGKELPTGEVKDHIKGNSLFSDSFHRMLEHLEKNGVKVDSATAVLGPMLSFDPKTEKFTGEFADAANELNMEPYRKEFSIPAV